MERKVHAVIPIESPSGPSLEEIQYGKKAPSVVRGVVALALISGAVLAYGVNAKSNYDKDKDWYSQSLVTCDQIKTYESQRNYSAAESLENNLWTEISRRRREGSWNTESELREISNRLNSNNTRGAKVGEPLD